MIKEQMKVKNNKSNTKNEDANQDKNQINSREDKSIQSIGNNYAISYIKEEIVKNKELELNCKCEKEHQIKQTIINKDARLSNEKEITNNQEKTVGAMLHHIRNKDEKEKQYNIKIKEEPHSLFILINEERVQMWNNKLSHNASKININDSDILNSFLNHNHQCIIKNDCIRTRVRESQLLDSFQEYIEYFLTYYVKQEKIQYKQGLNEIFAPFVLLKFKIGISLSNIYILAKRFIDKFLTNYYREMHLIAITASFNLYSILLKYHEPAIFYRLKQNEITPELYITSWMLTLFANKYDLDVIYQLWDYFITLDDNLMIYYLIVSLIQSNKETLLHCDVTCLPKVLGSIWINSVDEVHSVMVKALELREKTPYSFRFLSQNLELYQINNPQLQQAYNLYRPNEILAMPFFPSNLLFHTYSGIICCPDDKCFVLKNMAYKKVEKDNQIDKKHSQFIPLIKNNNYSCEHCDNKNVKQMSYILLDLRIFECESFEDWNENTGFLPNMIMVSQQELKEPNFASNIITRFQEDKNYVHFVLMTSETDYFIDFEKDFYLENNIEIDIFQSKYGNPLNKEKELNLELTQSLKKKEKMKLQEYHLFKKTLKAFIKADYPYVSYAYGGYKNVHNEALKYGITLLNHNTKCYLCKKYKKHDKIPKMSRYKASFYRKNFFIGNEKDLSSTGNSNIIISNSKILIPSISSSLPNKTNVKKIEEESLAFKSYYISKILETYLTQMVNSGDTHFIECSITKIDKSIRNKGIILNCLLVMNQQEFQIYKIVNSNKQQGEELNYVDKFLFVDLKSIDLDMKTGLIIIKLEGQKDLIINLYSNDKAVFIVNLINKAIQK